VWAAGERAELHPGMAPQVTALSAKHAVTTVPATDRKMGFTLGMLQPAERRGKARSDPRLRYHGPHRAMITRAPHVLDQAGTG
jgi:hypothetical protein